MSDWRPGVEAVLGLVAENPLRSVVVVAVILFGGWLVAATLEHIGRN